MKEFTHIPPPKNIQEMKTVEDEEGRFYLAPGEKRYPSVTTVVGFEKAHFFAKWRRENPEEAKAKILAGFKKAGEHKSKDGKTFAEKIKNNEIPATNSGK